MASIHQAFVVLCRSIYVRELVAAAGGNISVKLGRDEILITRRGSSFRNLTEEDIITIDHDGRVIEGSGVPSIETPIHLALYRAREDIGSVLHAHPPYATAFAALGETIPLLTVQASEILGEVKVIDYQHPGSEALTKLCTEAFRDRSVKAALLKSHGVIVVGSDMNDAYNNLDLLEETAKIAYLSSRIKTANPNKKF